VLAEGEALDLERDDVETSGVATEDGADGALPNED